MKSQTFKLVRWGQNGNEGRRGEESNIPSGAECRLVGRTESGEGGEQPSPRASGSITAQLVFTVFNSFVVDSTTNPEWTP